MVQGTDREPGRPWSESSISVSFLITSLLSLSDKGHEYYPKIQVCAFFHVLKRTIPAVSLHQFFWWSAFMRFDQTPHLTSDANLCAEEASWTMFSSLFKTLMHQKRSTKGWGPAGGSKSSFLTLNWRNIVLLHVAMIWISMCSDCTLNRLLKSNMHCWHDEGGSCFI